MCEWNNGGVVVQLPDDICVWKENRTVCIDECIVPQIRAVWDAGFNTLACCCGHGKESPDLVVEQDLDEEAINKIYSILREGDARHWRILQWQLLHVPDTDSDYKKPED